MALSYKITGFPVDGKIHILKCDDHGYPKRLCDGEEYEYKSTNPEFTEKRINQVTCGGCLKKWNYHDGQFANIKSKSLLPTLEELRDRHE